MSGYISRAACRGRRPSSAASFRGYQRPSLISRLLKERDVARFIVAPSGYGKTSLAVEYAETMFSWHHTFWLNAQSPCFIRDLDAGTLARGCIDADGEAALVVIDDLPPLDMRRAQLLSSELDQLLDYGCEVMVTCLPSADATGQFQRDRICLQAWDLLLDDGELDEDRTAEERLRNPAAGIAPSRRIAAIVWSEEGGCASFAANALKEELPSDLLLVMASILVLQRAAFEDLSALVAIDRDVLADLSLDYPHLGISEDLQTFDSVQLDVESLSAALKGRIDDLAERSRQGDKGDLAGAWADALLRNASPGRACDLIRSLCPRDQRNVWLAENAMALIGQTCFYPAFHAMADKKDLTRSVKARLTAFEALCRRVLGDEAGALQCAKRNAFEMDAPLEARACSALIVNRLGSGQLAERASGVLGEIAQASEAADDAGFPWNRLAEAWRCVLEGPHALGAWWGDAVADGLPDSALCVAASWYFASVAVEGGQGVDYFAQLTSSQRPVERYVRERLSACGDSVLDYFTASAGLSLVEAHTRGMPYCDGALEASALFALKQVEMNVLAQRAQFDQRVREAQIKRGDWVATRPDAYLDKSNALRASERSVPTLAVRLFGRFEASIGGVPIDESHFKRQHVRALLALLAVNQGREVQREQLAKSMWPAADAETRRKSFYTVWSCLRKALSLSDGTCPYLIRRQYGCSLSQRYVQSDAARLSEICRELLFSVPSQDRWSALFTEIDRDFSSELMPLEHQNQLLIQARAEYRSRLVDALVAATFSMIDAGNAQWGIWYSRSAIARDETREDAYVALMRAQIASNQRTSAMMTFLKCRRVLNDQLGIDPSAEANALYQSLLDEQ